MKIVKINWRDSNMYHEQGKSDYPFEVSTFESVGFLLKRDKDKAVIARDVLKDDSRSVLCIPNENITKFKEIKEI
jgi:hypothetical protein